jgi:hypothetical protein
VFTPGAGRWLFATHDLVFAIYAEWAIALLIIALTGETRRLAPGPARSGTRLMIASCWVGVGWTAWTLDDVANVLRSGVQDGSEDLVSNIFGVLTAGLVVASYLLVRWHKIAVAPRSWLNRYRTYRRLAPLWEALTAEMPQIALDDRPPLIGSRYSTEGLEFALYRRVIEIHDGRLALRPYLPERNISPKHEASAAHAEAASIAAALKNLRLGHRPTAAPDQDPNPPDRGFGSVHAEAAWLAQVSSAFARLE